MARRSKSMLCNVGHLQGVVCFPDEAFQWQEHVRARRPKPHSHVRRHHMQEDARTGTSAIDFLAQVYWTSVKGESHAALLGKVQHFGQESD